MSRPARFIFGSIGALALASPGHAHGLPAANASGWWTRWNPDPLTLASMVFLVVFYGYGLSRLMRRRGERATVRPRHVLAFGAGVIVLALALVSPVDGLADDLQWMHMVQHMLLMNVAAPLVVMGAPWRVMLWALPAARRRWPGQGRRALVRRGVPRYLFWQPLLLLVLYALVLWTWHVPVLYEAALANRWIHDGQHIAFFAVAALFWRVLFDPIGHLQMSRGTAILYLFGTSLHATVLGVLMALAPRLWYPTYAGRTEAWGLAALEDQQFAGYIMWMPACMVYAVIAAVLCAHWLREDAPEAARG